MYCPSLPSLPCQHLVEVCSPLPKVFKEVGEGYTHPGERQNTFLVEIIKQETGSGTEHLVFGDDLLQWEEKNLQNKPES